MQRTNVMAIQPCNADTVKRRRKQGNVPADVDVVAACVTTVVVVAEVPVLELDDPLELPTTTPATRVSVLEALVPNGEVFFNRQLPAPAPSVLPVEETKVKPVQTVLSKVTELSHNAKQSLKPLLTV